MTGKPSVRETAIALASMRKDGFEKGYVAGYLAAQPNARVPEATEIAHAHAISFAADANLLRRVRRG